MIHTLKQSYTIIHHTQQHNKYKVANTWLTTRAHARWLAVPCTADPPQEAIVHAKENRSSLMCRPFRLAARHHCQRHHTNHDDGSNKRSQAQCHLPLVVVNSKCGLCAKHVHHEAQTTLQKVLAPSQHTWVKFIPFMAEFIALIKMAWQFLIKHAQVYLATYFKELKH